MEYGYVTVQLTSLPGVSQSSASQLAVTSSSLRPLAAFKAAASAAAPESPTKRLTAALRAPTRDASVTVR